MHVGMHASNPMVGEYQEIHQMWLDFLMEGGCAFVYPNFAFSRENVGRTFEISKAKLQCFKYALCYSQRHIVLKPVCRCIFCVITVGVNVFFLRFLTDAVALSIQSTFFFQMFERHGVIGQPMAAASEQRMF